MLLMLLGLMPLLQVILVLFVTLLNSCGFPLPPSLRLTELRLPPLLSLLFVLELPLLFVR